MVTHPISISRNGYRGANRTKQLKAYKENQLASQLETFINDLLLKQEALIQVYSYHRIVADSGIPFEIVRRLGFSIDCGHNGFTAWRHDLTYEEAMNAL